MVVGKPLRKPLVLYCIYDRPLDHPNHFVVRRWHGLTPDKSCELCDSLREARNVVPRGLTCLSRLPQDDPTIVEVWL